MNRGELHLVLSMAANQAWVSLDLSFDTEAISKYKDFRRSDHEMLRIDMSEPITELPEEIGRLVHIESMKLGNNLLTHLPAEIGNLTRLTTLDLRGNKLKELPSEILELRRLKFLDLRDNNLPIPLEILQRCSEPQGILNYYFGIQTEATKPLNEAKMLLVGEGTVGKTSIIHRLVENTFVPEAQKKTEGVAIRHWSVTVDQQPIRVNIWDFGGQEIYHATHQFFLTNRSLYILVVDARQGEEKSRLEYWLKLIESFGGNSPIIVVINKIDEHIIDLNRRGLQAKYPSIHTFVPTSCLTGKGIIELHKAVSESIASLPHIHDRLLPSWFSIKENLEKMKLDFISYDEYTALCREQKITKEVDQKTLIRFLHDLGIVLNFQDDRRLEDTNVLNPQWITKGVYHILNHNFLFQSKGVLDINDMGQILDKHEYPKHKYMFIIDIMQKFELCFPFVEQNTKYLIPGLLQREESDINWDEDDSLALEYHYNVLPSSIFHRFIVRMHAHISKKTYWYSGVVLADGSNKALVKADFEDKKIFIYVAGMKNTRRDFLSRIRAQFKEIHSSMAKIEALEEVPIPKYLGETVSYRELLSLESNKIQTHFYPKINATINVQQLLDGIEKPHERDYQVTTNQASVSDEQLDLPRLPDLRTLKAALDMDAQRYARNRLLFLTGTIAIFWTFLGILTINKGWPIMAPVMAFIGGSVIVFCYAYFAVTQREWSPKELFNKYVDKKRVRNYKKHCFDINRYTRLENLKQKLEKESLLN